MADQAQRSDAEQLPASLRCMQRFTYDLARYPFPTLVADVLAMSTPLDKLHTSDEVQDWLSGVRRNGARAYAMRRNVVDCKFKDAGSFRAVGALQDAYLAFVDEVIAPLITLEDEAQEASELLYQRDPNFRAHIPGTGHHLTQRHRDADYHHQPLEVNIWIPLTNARASNTLWVESSPGAADFAPFEACPGEGIRFWGHSCEHYTLPNETDETRVSFDFRVLPTSLYRETYPNSHRKDGLARFGLGGFFAQAGVQAAAAQALSTRLHAAGLEAVDGMHAADVAQAVAEIHSLDLGSISDAPVRRLSEDVMS